MPRVSRALALVLALSLGGAALAEARGGGGGRVATAGGGMKRGKRSSRGSAQVETLIQESFRRDALQRLRQTDW